MLRLVLFQPDIPQNTGAMLRLGACLGLGIEIVEPCGFVLDDRRLRRAALDYGVLAAWRRHASWAALRAAAAAEGGRLVLLSTTGTRRLDAFRFTAADWLVLGRETCGVDDEVRGSVAASLRVPLRRGARSLNVALAAAIAAGEALRQTGGFPDDEDADGRFGA